MSQDGKRADRVAAWATGIGIGWITFMVSWLLGNRLAGLLWDAPTGPILAMAVAVGLAIGIAIGAGLRMVRRVNTASRPGQPAWVRPQVPAIGDLRPWHPLKRRGILSHRSTRRKATVLTGREGRRRASSRSNT